ncbi:DNA N(6)-methyladenine demethylase ALKBH1D-like isoform X2 [Silene latifolia]|uniref:DNA N(6)-methyladenine demethylase ALKBH1D-like isoform X2 n=1 Tax=Silene latifolia TaxID=37657 RepID=UPI003D76F7A4
MMVVRLYCVTRTSTVALLFPSYTMSTLGNLSSQSSLRGDESLSNTISITGQGAEAARTIGITSCNSKKFFSSGSKNSSSANESESSTSETSIGCSKESDLRKECSLSCVSSMDTSMTELLEPRLEQDDEFLYYKPYKDMLVEHSLPTSFGKQKFKKQRSAEHGLKHVIHRSNKKSSKYHLESFDICQCETERTDIGDSEIEYFSFLKSSDVLIEEPTRVIRPGMVLLKKYISPTEQISIARKCRDLGLGPGGFYHPGYKNGSKLRLRMMCLGLDWDPQTRKYQKRRRIDRAKAPDIPSEFHMLVSRAMQDSLSLIREDPKVCNAEEILPQMTPDVCIVNFYTETGRLGLHQDRDESEESLSKGLPVVSFSVGDAAEFLHGNQRDVNKAEKLVLESGDVLIFGGESRHVFHGINSIIPHSAPPFLLEAAKLRPGRLNLTFRQH